MDGAVWRASAPDGYLPLGDIWRENYDEPPKDAMYVVKKECVVQCDQTPQLIYSGAPLHVINDTGDAYQVACRCDLILPTLDPCIPVVHTCLHRQGIMVAARCAGLHRRGEQDWHTIARQSWYV